MNKFFLITLLLSTQAWAQTFTLRLLSEPETLDWNKAHTPVENHILNNIMEGLLILDQDLKAVPGLAESYKISAAKKVYTFNIRKNAKWSDGREVTAQDFYDSWKRLLTASTAASYAYFLFDVDGAQDFYLGKNQDFSKVGIKVKSKLVFEVTLKEPVAHWIYIPTFWVTFPVRSDVIKKCGEKTWAVPSCMLTAGPYTLKSHELDQKYVFDKNPHYYGKVGNVDQFVGLVVKDDSTALSLFDSGKIDLLTDLPVLDQKRLQKQVTYKSFPYLKTVYLGFHNQKNPTQDVKLRQAIARSINKLKIPELLQGGQTEASSFLPKAMLAHREKAGIAFEKGSQNSEYKNLKLDLGITNWEKPASVAQYIQSELKNNLGLQVNIKAYDHKTFRSELDLGAFHMFLTSWSADYPDPDNFMSLFLGDSGNNRARYKNLDYDKKVLLARKTHQIAARKKIYEDIEKQLIERDAAIIPLFYEPNTALLSARVKGLKINPVNYFYIRQLSVY